MRRLLLFDIDGTLVWGGPAKGAFEMAMESVFGTAGPIEGHDFSGKTDPQIARELLRLAGVPDEEHQQVEYLRFGTAQLIAATEFEPLGVDFYVCKEITHETPSPATCGQV